MEEEPRPHPYDLAVAAGLPRLTAALGVAYLIDPLVRVLRGGSAAAPVVVVGETVAASVFLLIAWFSVRDRLQPRHREAATVVIVVVVSADVVLRATVTGAPWLTANLILGVIATAAVTSSVVGFTTGGLVVWTAFLATFLVDLWVADRPLDVTKWVHLLLAMVAATLLATAVRGMRMRALEDLLGARRLAEDLSVRDALTGAANRRGMEMTAVPMIEHARRQGEAVHCLFIDVDGFKAINDSLGHRAGDKVLVAVVEALRAATRNTDVVARWAGDEFVVVGPGTGTSPLEMERRVRARFAADPPVPAHVWPGTISVGQATLVPWDAGDLESLLSRADQDMYLRRSLRRQGPSALAEDPRRPVPKAPEH